MKSFRDMFDSFQPDFYKYDSDGRGKERNKLNNKKFNENSRDTIYTNENVSIHAMGLHVFANSFGLNFS